MKKKIKDNVISRIRRIADKCKSNRAIGGAAVAVLVLSLAAWPALAEETFDNPEQVVEEVEPTEEPTATPGVTAEPVVTDEPENTSEPTKEPPQDGEEEKTGEDEDAGKTEDENGAPAVPSDSAEPTAEPDGADGGKPVSDDGGNPSVSRRRAAARSVSEADLSSPAVTKSEDCTFTYNAIPDGTSLFVQLAKDDYDADKEIPSYQWYRDDQKLDSATRASYALPTGLGAGDYIFKCVVSMVAIEDTSVSKQIAECEIKVTVEKAEPELSDFSYDIKNKLYYNAQDQTPAVSVKDGITGMGSVAVLCEQAEGGLAPNGVKEPGEYRLRLTVSEGTNYNAATIFLANVEVVTIEKPRTCTVSGTKGNKVDGVQWYKSDVTFTAPTGYLISLEETGEYAAKKVYSAEGLQASENIYYKEQKTGGIWGTEAMPEFGIDKTAPSAELMAGTDSISLVHFFNKNQTITLQATDNISSSDNLKYYMYVSRNKPISGLVSKVAWTETDSVTVEDATQYYVYGKVVDEAGNEAYVSSDGIVIDAVKPTILCNGNTLKDNRTYTADEKSFSVEDENLASVTYQPENGQAVTVDIENTTSFTLKSPDTEGASYRYTIVASDKAGNETSETVTLVNPVQDCNIARMDFDNLTYGYSLDGLAKEPSITRGAGNNVSDLYFEKVTVLPDDEGEVYFTAELDGSGGFTVTPKAGLHVGTYQNVIRVDYKGISDEEATRESTTKFTCSLTVDRATLHAVYTGHTAYYHTYPDFTGHVEINEEELKNNDTLKELQKEDAFLEALTVEYLDDSGQNKRAMETDATVIPVGGQTRDYEIAAVSGTMTVVRRDAARNKEYKMNGTEGTDGWYTSDVAVAAGASSQEAPQGYLVGSAEDSISDAEIPVTVSEPNGETEGQDITFYVMNRSTGEIFNPVTETVKIDKNAPYLADGEGISIAKNLWQTFWHTITFNQYFNDTMSVSISGSDAFSGIDEDTGISYYVSSQALSTEQVKNVAWVNGKRFSLEPDDLETKIVYAKITDRAGLSLYISSNGMVFDNKVPSIEVVKDGEEYITEQKDITVSDSNLLETTLYEGTDTTVSGTAIAVENLQSKLSIPCPEKGSKTYTIVAKDSANNLAEKSFTITKPIYDITADRMVLKDAVYGYTTAPAAGISWKNTSEANADATVSQVSLSNTRQFEVQEIDGQYYVAAKKGLDAGNYSTSVVLTYNGGKAAETTATVTVQKASLTAKYKGQSVYFHMTPDYEQAVEVTGFVNGENAETAAGYEAPVVSMKGAATETDVLTPEGGRADNYEFVYEKGVLVVNRREAVSGVDGQYEIAGTVSDTGWYISDITLTPKQGFVFVSNEEGLNPQESIVLTEDTANGKELFYVMNETTGEIYEQSVFEYCKDVQNPVISGVRDGETYVVNSQEVNIKDDYLASVTVNGAAQEIKDGAADVILSADYVNTVYVLVATDYAGHVNNISIVLKQPSEVNEPSEADEPSGDSQNGTGTDETEELDGETPAPSENTGTVRKKVSVVEGAPQTAITSKTAQLLTSVLSKGEQQAVSQGSNADVELRIQNIDNTVSQEDKELIISNLNGYTVGQYLDITLWKTVGSSTAKKVSSTNKSIAVTITVPETLRNRDSSRTRTYAIFRVHNGTVSILPDKDSVESTVTFNTDKFSTYVLAYKDTIKKTKLSDGGDSGASTRNLNILSSIPDMGDHAPVALSVLLLAVALIGIVTVIIIRKRCERKQ